MDFNIRRVSRRGAGAQRRRNGFMDFNIRRVSRRGAEGWIFD